MKGNAGSPENIIQNDDRRSEGGEAGLGVLQTRFPT